MISQLRNAIQSREEIYLPFAAELRQHLDKDGGEFLVEITSDTSPTLDTLITVCFPEADHNTCFDVLRRTSEHIGARCSPILSGPAKSTYLIRRLSHIAEDNIEVRFAVLGNVDAGKSTLLGVLTKGALDNGRGRARADLFRYKHEIETGRTSSIGTEVMGFCADGSPVIGFSSYDQRTHKISWEDISDAAAKVVSFIDLAGHERYLKTTVFGLTSQLPDYVILMVGANAGLVGMSKEHLGLALALGIPVVVVVSKVDMCPPEILSATLAQIRKVVQSPGCRKTPVMISTKEDVLSAALKLPIERICPVFQVSSVTGQNLDLLSMFMNLIPSSQAQYAPLQSKPVELPISDVFNVPFVGTVVSGVLTSGIVKVGDPLLLGPDGLGNFVPTSVRSIHRRRVNVECASAGQSVCFALKRIRPSQVRKGMLLLSTTEVNPSVHREFEAEILCLYHSTTLSVGSCIVMHASSVRQTVRIIEIAKSSSSDNHHSVSLLANDGAKPIVRMGDRALVRFQFTCRPEYITPGTKLIAREGKTKLVGIVSSVGEQGIMPTSLPEHSRRIAHGPTAPLIRPGMQVRGAA